MAESGRLLMICLAPGRWKHLPDESPHRKTVECAAHGCVPATSAVAVHNAETDTGYCQAPECLAARVAAQTNDAQDAARFRWLLTHVRPEGAAVWGLPYPRPGQPVPASLCELIDLLMSEEDAP